MSRAFIRLRRSTRHVQLADESGRVVFELGTDGPPVHYLRRCEQRPGQALRVVHVLWIDGPPLKIAFISETNRRVVWRSSWDEKSRWYYAPQSRRN